MKLLDRITSAFEFILHFWNKETQNFTGKFI